MSDDARFEESGTEGAGFEEYTSAGGDTADGSFARNGLVQDFAAIIYEYKFWFKLCGILSVISGGITCLTIVGVIVGIPYILMGLAILRIVKKTEESLTSGSIAAFSEVLLAVRRFFKISGVVVLIGIFMIIIQFAFGLLPAIIMWIRSV